MRHVIESWCRRTGVAVLLVLLAILPWIHSRTARTATRPTAQTDVLLAILPWIHSRTAPVAYGGDEAAPKPLASELARAIRDGDLKAVRAQLDASVDVNARDADDNTPLLLAAVYAGTECVELLITAGQVRRVHQG